MAKELGTDDLASLAEQNATYISGHGVPGRFSSTILVRATDDMAARQVIETALGADVVVREVKATPIFVYAPVSAESRAAFEAAAANDARVGGIVEDEESGDLEVYFEMAPMDLDRAMNEARGIYSRIVVEAGIDMPEGLEFTMSGFEAILYGPSPWRSKLEESRALLDEGKFDLSLVVATTACELITAEVIPTLIEPHVSGEMRAWALGSLRRRKLTDKPTRRLWSRIAGSAIEGQSFWVDYLLLVELRNGVVHRGEEIDEAQCRQALRAAGSYLDYLERSVGHAPEPVPRAPSS